MSRASLLPAFLVIAAVARVPPADAKTVKPTSHGLMHRSTKRRRRHVERFLARRRSAVCTPRGAAAAATGLRLRRYRRPLA